jgi:SOS-response transcriptional repressor LexA
MQPTLAEGDLLVVDRQRAVYAGCLAVADLPDGPTAVKRVVHGDDDGWWLERDNPRVGVDSWTVGAVPPDAVHGVVLARLWPRPLWLGRRCA